MSLNDYLAQQERLIKIAGDVATELKEELAGDWHLEAIGKKRKITPPDEFYSEEYPTKYEAPENYEY